MRFNSSLKQSVAVSLAILSLICIIGLASAYFTTFEMSAKYDEDRQSMVSSGDNEQGNPKVSMVASDDKEQENPKDSHCDSKTMKCPKPVFTLKDRYVASMVLSGVGDALGYHRGDWEFNKDGVAIHDELEKKYKGLEALELRGSQWIVSDDTVMHLATADALVEFGNGTKIEKLFKILSKKYIECMKDMDARAPGPTCIFGVSQMERKKTYKIPFNSRGGGCGAAMRAMCIGLRYPAEDQLDDLIAVSIESGRMTHHHPTGYLGGLASALFTSYAIQDRPMKSWGKGLMTVLEKAKMYIEAAEHDVEENLETWSYFEKQWEEYLFIRNLSDGESTPVFPPDYDVKERDDFYKSRSFSGWGGSSGHDAPMIAYDALLGSNDSWLELCRRGMLHGGDSDSTGAIAGAWFGALYGYHDVPEKHYKHLEYIERLEKVGTDIYDLSQSNRSSHKETSHKETSHKENPRKVTSYKGSAV